MLARCYHPTITTLNVLSHMSFFDLLKLISPPPERSRKTNTPFQTKGLAELITESVVSHVFCDHVSPLAGSIVRCDLISGYAEHTGIYIGNNRIVHLNGEGAVESVTPIQFLNRLDGINSAISIYVSCKDGAAVGSAKAAERAASMIGKSRKYNLLFDNCHQFTSGCFSGNFENSTNMFQDLQREAKKYIQCNNWRVWQL